MDSSIIFSSGSSEANTFYKEFGYIHYRSNSSLFISKINKCFAYYSKPQTKESNNVAFRNKDGKPRHFIDVFRDLSSETLNIYSSKVIKALIEKNVPKNNRFIFTHSKMSFKQVDSNGGWYPHQDNGYKSEGDIREGFAIFICLEDMSEANGCIQLFPGSHKLGLLPHSRFIEDEKTGDNQFFIGKIPIFSIGSIKLIEKLMLLIKILYNPYFYWRIIKKNRKLALIVRKLKYKFN